MAAPKKTVAKETGNGSDHALEFTREQELRRGAAHHSGHRLRHARLGNDERQRRDEITHGLDLNAIQLLVAEHRRQQDEVPNAHRAPFRNPTITYEVYNE